MYPLTQQSRCLMQSTEKLPDLYSLLSTPDASRSILRPPLFQSSGRLRTGPVGSKVSSCPCLCWVCCFLSLTPRMSTPVALGPARCSSSCSRHDLLPPVSGSHASCHFSKPQRLPAPTPHLCWLSWPLPAWTLALGMSSAVPVLA